VLDESADLVISSSPGKVSVGGMVDIGQTSHISMYWHGFQARPGAQNHPCLVATSRSLENLQDAGRIDMHRRFGGGDRLRCSTPSNRG